MYNGQFAATIGPFSNASSGFRLFGNIPFGMELQGVHVSAFSLIGTTAISQRFVFVAVAFPGGGVPSADLVGFRSGRQLFTSDVATETGLGGIVLAAYESGGVQFYFDMVVPAVRSGLYIGLACFNESGEASSTMTFAVGVRLGHSVSEVPAISLSQRVSSSVRSRLTK